MAITNKGELVAFVTLAGNRSDLAAVIPDFINAAHSRLTPKVSVFAPIDIEAGVTAPALPADFEQVTELWIKADPMVQLQPVSARQLAHVANSGACVPKVYDAAAGVLTLGPSPDQAYEGRLLYKVASAFFADDADTNLILQRYPMLYVHAAVAELARFLFNGELEDRREALLSVALDEANARERARCLDGGVLQMSPSTGSVA